MAADQTHISAGDRLVTSPECGEPDRGRYQRRGSCSRNAAASPAYVLIDKRRRFSLWFGQERASGSERLAGSWLRPRRRAKPAARGRAGSRNSNGRRATAGAAGAASQPRRNRPEAPPIRTLSSPRWAAGMPRRNGLRGDILRPCGDMRKSHQRVSARTVRRPHFGGDDARQPATVVVCLDGLCAGLRAAPHCFRRVVRPYRSLGRCFPSSSVGSSIRSLRVPD